MKSSIYFLSVIVSSFLGSIFLIENANLNSDNEKELEVHFFYTEWENNYIKCEQMIDSVNKNNDITKENFKFVENTLSQIKQ